MSLNINVGCGMTPTKGWKNFDNSWSVRLARYPILVFLLRTLNILKPTQLDYINFATKNRIYWANVSRYIPLANNSVEVLYTSHMLEHLDRKKARTFLTEAKRVLKPGGIIRISVPDLQLLVKGYIERGDADDFIEKLHMNRDNPDSPLETLKQLLVGNRHHQWNYDAGSLCKLLTLSGFKEPIVMDAGSTTISEPGALDLYERAEESLYVEATKS